MTYPMSDVQRQRLHRRDLLKSAGVAAALAGGGALAARGALAQTPVTESLIPSLVIDFSGVPESIDPALAYSARDWSVVHSIYDSPLALSATGEIVPLAAESFRFIEPTILEIVLRSGLTFHDGTAVTSAAIARSIEHVKASESEAAGLFAVISDVAEVDDLTIHLATEAPAAWLPAQIAVWVVLVPEGFTSENALTAPVGSGPYAFATQESGSHITLRRNPDYPSGMAKGDPIAEEVVYRFVPEVTTRMADLVAGQAHIITEVPHDQIATVEGQGNTGIEHAVVGSHWIRIATDVAPFDLPEVRQALNHAIDAEAIAQTLVSPESHRLSSLFPDDRSLAFNPDLVPYTYDPDRARTLLDSVGLDSIDVEMEITSAARVDVAEAIAAQLSEVGINVSIVVSEYGAFNANWVESSAPALRLVTWGPLYEPQTLLGLVFRGSGYLSRYHNDEVDTLIDAGAAETDLEARRSIYAELTQVMYDDAPAVYLWNLAAGYGVAPLAAAWSSRGDEYVLPLHLEDSSV